MCLCAIQINTITRERAHHAVHSFQNVTVSQELYFFRSSHFQHRIYSRYSFWADRFDMLFFVIIVFAVSMFFVGCVRFE